MKKFWNDFGISTITVFLIILIPLILDIWVENMSGDFWEKYLRNAYIYKLPIWILIIIILIISNIISILVKKRIEESNKRVEQVEIEKHNLTQKFDELTKSQSTTLLRKYEELRYFETQKSLNNILTKYVKNHTYLSAAQIYKYEKSIDTANSKMMFKLYSPIGHVKEKLDLNGMIQAYYYIDLELYNTYRRISIIYSLNTHNSTQLTLKEDKAITDAIIFLQAISIKIEKANRDVSRLDDDLFWEYHLFKDVYKHLVEKLSIEISSLTITEELENAISNYKIKRSNILLGNLYNAYYKASYTGNNHSKRGRTYEMHNFNFLGEKYILLLTFDIPAGYHVETKEFVHLKEIERQILKLANSPLQLSE